MNKTVVALCSLLLVAVCAVGAARGETIPAIRMMAHPPSYADRLDVRYRKPAGAGPFPAVVLMHGCAGWHGDNIQTWGDWYLARGYAVLAVDSFTTRGVKRVCGGTRQVLVRQRVGDAYAALQWLAERPEIDARRVVLMGFSHGGQAVLTALLRANVARWSQVGALRFRAGVAAYPPCPTFKNPGFYAPIVILAGSEDTWTPPAKCRRLVAANKPTDPPLEMTVFEGATHSFDSTAWRGKPVGERIAHGHILRPDPAAILQAREVAGEFLQRVAKLP